MDTNKFWRIDTRVSTRRDLEKLIGSRGRVAEVLNHKRGLTWAMIRRLHEGLGISAEVLIREGISAMISASKREP